MSHYEQILGANFSKICPTHSLSPNNQDHFSVWILNKILLLNGSFFTLSGPTSKSQIHLGRPSRE